MTTPPIVAADTAAAAQACARRVAALLLDALSRQEAATFAISGGSTPKLLFDHLAAAPLPLGARAHFLGGRALRPAHR